METARIVDPTLSGFRWPRRKKTKNKQEPKPIIKNEAQPEFIDTDENLHGEQSDRLGPSLRVVVSNER